MSLGQQETAQILQFRTERRFDPTDLKTRLKAFRPVAEAIGAVPIATKPADVAERFYDETCIRLTRWEVLPKNSILFLEEKGAPAQPAGFRYDESTFADTIYGRGGECVALQVFVTDADDVERTVFKAMYDEANGVSIIIPPEQHDWFKSLAMVDEFIQTAADDFNVEL